jgi:hypothetical protein
LPTAPTLEPYLRGTRLQADALSGDLFAWLVGMWLNDLVSPYPGEAGAAARWGGGDLSRVAERVRGGRVEPDAED